MRTGHRRGVSAGRTSARRSAASPGRASECGAIIGFEAGKSGIEHFAPGNDDHIEAGGRLVAPKDLTHQPFGPIPLHGPPEFPRRDDAEAGHVEAVGQGEEGQIAAVHPHPLVVGPFEMRAALDALGRPQPCCQS
jgi:hypothetical protein